MQHNRKRKQKKRVVTVTRNVVEPVSCDKRDREWRTRRIFAPSFVPFQVLLLSTSSTSSSSSSSSSSPFDFYCDHLLFSFLWSSTTPDSFMSLMKAFLCWFYCRGSHLISSLTLSLMMMMSWFPHKQEPCLQITTSILTAIEPCVEIRIPLKLQSHDDGEEHGEEHGEEERWCFPCFKTKIPLRQLFKRRVGGKEIWHKAWIRHHFFRHCYSSRHPLTLIRVYFS